MSSLKKVSFSNVHSSISEIEEYYVDSEAALENYFSGNELSSRFIGYSLKMLQDELKEKKATLDRMCSLELLASIEARLRIDYLIRCQKKHKDSLSRKFREIYSEKANRASLLDEIAFTWQQEFPEHKARLDNLRKAIDYRNWLAHGRYWQSKKTPHIYKYDYLAIYNLTTDIFNEMDLLEA